MSNIPGLSAWTAPKNNGTPLGKLSRVDRKTAKAQEKAAEDALIVDAVKAAQPKRGRISARLRDTIMKRDKETCTRCGAKNGDLDENGEPVTLHIGHIIPWIQNGPTNEANCRVECSRCNLGAGARRDTLAISKPVTVDNSKIVKQLTALVGKKVRK